LIHVLNDPLGKIYAGLNVKGKPVYKNSAYILYDKKLIAGFLSFEDESLFQDKVDSLESIKGSNRTTVDGKVSLSFEKTIVFYTPFTKNPGYIYFVSTEHLTTLRDILLDDRAAHPNSELWKY